MSEQPTVQVNKTVYFYRQRPEMLKYIPEDAQRILEVGCNDGTFCSTLRRSDRELWGVELNPEAGEKAKKVCDHVLIGDFNEVFSQLPQNYFDCVIFNDVLEHIYSP